MDGRLLYVTFNYDTLLEQALERYLPVRFDSVGKYLHDDWSVVKVHGSENWVQNVYRADGRDLAGSTVDTIILAAADGLATYPVFHVVADCDTLQVNGSYVAPVVAIPIPSKGDKDWACPADHLDRMRAWLIDASAVLTIGWKGQEPHFLRELQKLRDHDVPVNVVTRLSEDDPAEVSCEDHGLTWLTDASLSGPCRVIRTGFSRFAVRDRLNEFVASLPVG